MSKLISLEIENIKKVKAVRIKPNGKPIYIIGGANGQGKSSVLDSIEYALGGKPNVSMPIRQGENKAKIILETDEIIVNRRFTEKGSYIQVVKKDGDERYEIKSPQAILDKITSNLAFDPLNFVRQKPKEQITFLRELTGVDFTEADASYTDTYNERTNINRDIKKLKTKIDDIDVVEAPDDEVSINDLMNELTRREEINRNSENQKKLSQDKINECKKQNQIIIDKKTRIKELQSDLKLSEELLKKIELDRIELDLESESMVIENIEEIKDQIGNAEKINNNVRRKKEHEQLIKELNELTSNETRLTNKLQKITKWKEDEIKKADFPVDGLSFGSDGILFNNIPFDQCSSAEQLRVSVAMGLAKNPELKLLVIKDGSLLDEDSLNIVESMAKDADATVIIERVGEGSECSVIIEDGEIK